MMAGDRVFLDDILIASTGRGMGATIDRFNAADFELTAAHVDIDVAAPWPDGLAA